MLTRYGDEIVDAILVENLQQAVLSAHRLASSNSNVDHYYSGSWVKPVSSAVLETLPRLTR